MFFFSIKKDMKIHLYEKKSSTHVFMEIKKENNNNFATSQLIFFDNIDVFSHFKRKRSFGSIFV